MQSNWSYFKRFFLQFLIPVALCWAGHSATVDSKELSHPCPKSGIPSWMEGIPSRWRKKEPLTAVNIIAKDGKLVRSGLSWREKRKWRGPRSGRR